MGLSTHARTDNTASQRGGYLAHSAPWDAALPPRPVYSPVERLSQAEGRVSGWRERGRGALCVRRGSMTFESVSDKTTQQQHRAVTSRGGQKGGMAIEASFSTPARELGYGRDRTSYFVSPEWEESMVGGGERTSDQESIASTASPAALADAKTEFTLNSADQILRFSSCATRELEGLFCMPVWPRCAYVSHFRFACTSGYGKLAYDQKWLP